MNRGRAVYPLSALRLADLAELHMAELVARADPEFGEDLVKVVFDGFRADEQAAANVGIGEAVAGQLCDLIFLGS